MRGIILLMLALCGSVLLTQCGGGRSEKKRIEADNKKMRELDKAMTRKYTTAHFDKKRTYRGEASYPPGQVMVKNVKCPEYERLSVGLFYGMLGAKNGLPFCIMSKKDEGDIELFAIDFNQNNDLSDDAVYSLAPNRKTADISLVINGHNVPYTAMLWRAGKKKGEKAPRALLTLEPPAK